MNVVCQGSPPSRPTTKPLRSSGKYVKSNKIVVDDERLIVCNLYTPLSPGPHLGTDGEGRQTETQNPRVQIPREWPRSVTVEKWT